MRLATLFIVIGLVGCEKKASVIPERPMVVEAEPAGKEVSQPGSVDERLFGIWERTKISGKDQDKDRKIDHMIWLIRDDGTCWLKEYSLSKSANGRGYNTSLEIDQGRNVMTVLGFEIRYSLSEFERGYILKTDFVDDDIHQEFIKLK